MSCVGASYVDQIYSEAAKATGKTETQLRLMGLQIFSSVLRHIMERPSETIWTVASLDGQQLNIEVNFPPHLRASAVNKR